MPATYTHYYFGQLVLKQLPISYQQQIQKHLDLYNIGQHGPDILFYHYPLMENKIMRLGYDTHHIEAFHFFDKASKLHQHHEVDLVYLYGFICHFVLDAYCHPYVLAYVQSEGVSHFEIEMQWDRYLLNKQGLNVFKYSISQHVHPSKSVEKVIAPYFEITKSKDIHHALVQMNALHRLLKSSSDLKRWALYHGMDLLHISKYKDQVISKYPNPKCEKSNHDLDTLIQKAVFKAVELIQSFETYGASDELYHHTFG